MMSDNWLRGRPGCRNEEWLLVMHQKNVVFVSRGALFSVSKVIRIYIRL